MRTLTLLLIVPVLLLIASFRTTPTPEPVSDPVSSPSGTAHAIATLGTITPREEYAATLVPEAAEELSLWPQAAAGALVFEEVLPHGSIVSEGAIVARVGTQALEIQVASAARASAVAELGLRGVTERGVLAAEASVAARMTAERQLAEAREDRTRWIAAELADLVRGDELSLRRQQHYIDDAHDELTQLELMYSDDELVQATEEIVLRRSRRDLAQQRDEFGLAEKASARRAALRVRTTATRERAVADAERALKALGVEQALAAAEQQRALAAAAAALDDARTRLARLEHDLEACTLRAPRAGVLLHGSLSGWARGQRANHERGGTAITRKGLFIVADPDRLAASFSLPAADRARVPSGAGVTMRVAGTTRDVVGRVEVERYPGADGALAARVVFERALIGSTAGTPASVAVAGAPEKVLLLPAVAVHGTGGDRWCWIAGEGENYRRVAVTVTETHGVEVAIEGDVSEGARALLAED